MRVFKKSRHEQCFLHGFSFLFLPCSEVLSVPCSICKSDVNPLTLHQKANLTEWSPFLYVFMPSTKFPHPSFIFSLSFR